MLTYAVMNAEIHAHKHAYILTPSLLHLPPPASFPLIGQTHRELQSALNTALKSYVSDVSGWPWRISAAPLSLSLFQGACLIYLWNVIFFLSLSLSLSSGWGTETPRRLMLLFKGCPAWMLLNQIDWGMTDAVKQETARPLWPVISFAALFPHVTVRERAIYILRRQHNRFLLM